MNAIILLANSNTANSTGYIVGGIVSVFILAYLVYSLIKPEKF
ncbi:MAG TPA: K(+)-transporting ATPase subunit F [Williamwhitmania sp.]|jgi:K+-transporting ATPase, KdpF subunit|nr:K(+)-transporting ATPase subunit F [Williamwhitmania sp.]